MTLETTARYKISTYIGLFIVLILTTIFWFPSVYKSILSKNFEVRNYQMQGFDWLIVLTIVIIILFGEKQRLPSLNIKRPTWATLATGLGLGGFSMVYIVLHRLILNAFGVTTGFEAQTENPALNEVGPEFIYVYGIFSLITASVAEEIIYRGYATERLLKLSNVRWLAFVLPLAAFVLMHYRKGLDHLLIVLVVGSLMQLYYLKFRISHNQYSRPFLH